MNGRRSTRGLAAGRALLLDIQSLHRERDVASTSATGSGLQTPGVGDQVPPPGDRAAASGTQLLCSVSVFGASRPVGILSMAGSSPGDASSTPISSAHSCFLLSVSGALT